jgi:P4 family phage/plasmid primase-like protien
MPKTTNNGSDQARATRPFATEQASSGELRTPNSILAAMFPDLTEYGDAFSYDLIMRKLLEDGEQRKVLCWVPKCLNERFFAGYLARHQHAVFDHDAKTWLLYTPQGYYAEIKAEELHEPLDLLLREIAKSCPNTVDTTPLLFRFRATKSLTPIITKASGLCVVKGDFWRWPEGLIPLRNGVLDLRTKILHSHSHEYHFRGVMQVDYVPGADCPQWKKLLNDAVDADNASLIQRCFGLSLTGSNFAQKFLLLTGTSQGGKGVIIRVWVGLLGPQNVGTLRTRVLHERFEIGRLCHKMLIYAGDVPQNFLNNQGAYVLKRIVGQDPESPEFKSSNATPAAEPIYGFPVVTANSRLRVRFEGDKEAWRRRVLLIHFEKMILEDSQEVELDKQLHGEEGPGIFNWALEGLHKLLDDGARCC